jgi:hypothetical protein
VPPVDLLCGDDPAAWAELGFAVEEGELVRVGGVRLRCDGAGGGLRGWVLPGDGPADLDGIPTQWIADPIADADAPAHPNGALSVDHVVLFTDNRDRTAAALAAAGGDERRRMGPPVVPVAMAFVRLDGVIVEVAEGGGPPALWGLVAVVEDLDACVAASGGLVGRPKDAVQPGRRIATVGRQAGLGTQLAFMSPRVLTGGGGGS